MRFVLVSSVMSCVVFKGNINKKASKTDFMLQIFPIPFLTFPVESKISHVTETEVSVKHSKKKDVLFIIGDWNVKISQEIPGVTGKFGL